jgi:hypothetical protein
MTNTLQDTADRHDDSACQTTATAFLTSLSGRTPTDLQWDNTHHLQGHATCSGHPIVVIAARDTAHTAIVMTRDNWNSMRRSNPPDRTQILHGCAIRNHAQFLQMLATN